MINDGMNDNRKKGFPMGVLSGVIAVNVESHQKRGATNEGTQTRASGWMAYY